MPVSIVLVFLFDFAERRWGSFSFAISVFVLSVSLTLKTVRPLRGASVSRGNYSENPTHMENKRNDCFVIVGFVINCTLETCSDLGGI